MTPGGGDPPGGGRSARIAPQKRKRQGSDTLNSLRGLRLDPKRRNATGRIRLKEIANFTEEKHRHDKDPIPTFPDKSPCRLEWYTSRARTQKYPCQDRHGKPLDPHPFLRRYARYGQKSRSGVRD